VETIDESAEVPVEGDQDPPAPGSPIEHRGVGAAGPASGDGGNVMAGRAQGLDAGDRDVLVGEQPHYFDTGSRG